ncbi:hypothetical protein ACIQB5_48090 [Streptomyces sp. NPDC088560]|uniref:hypothetical protein n=1 Tax=Streptomyces sp. NPDC088560 TaxID=3365868 RepID=UPI003811D6A1
MPRQIVAYGRFPYWFQCRLEFDGDVVQGIIESAEKGLAGLDGHRFVQQPEQLRRNDHRALNEQCGVFRIGWPPTTP